MASSPSGERRYSRGVSLATSAAVPPPQGVDACVLYTTWLYRYPRLLGRIWRGGLGDPPGATLDVPTDLMNELKRLPPFRTPTFPSQGFEIEADRSVTDGFVLHPDGWVLPVPQGHPAVSVRYITQLAEWGGGGFSEPRSDAVALQHGSYAHPWALPLGQGGQAEQRANLLRQGGSPWALTTQALAYLERVLREAIVEVWADPSPDSPSFADRINARLQPPNDQRFTGFSVSVDDRVHEPGLWSMLHFPNTLLFTQSGASIPTCPGAPENALRDAEEKPPCPVIPCRRYLSASGPGFGGGAATVSGVDSGEGGSLTGGDTQRPPLPAPAAGGRVAS